jgi:hypothetical protein
VSSTDDRKLRGDDRERHDGKQDRALSGPVRRLVVAGQPTGLATINDERTHNEAEAARTGRKQLTRDQMFGMIERRIQSEVERICRQTVAITREDLRTLDDCSTILARHARNEAPMSADEYERQERAKRGKETPA